MAFDFAWTEIQITMITILTWISIVAGGLLIILLVLSLISGLDFDLDIDTGSADIDTDPGGLGILKGALTFISVSSWVVKLLLATEQSPFIAVLIGVLIGLLAMALLSYLVRVLLRNDENVNWELEDAMFQTGTVYLRIPKEGQGIVNINVKGVNRELKAKQIEEDEISTGELVRVVDIEGEIVIVKRESIDN